MSYNRFREQKAGFSNANAQSSPRPDLSKEEYGRYRKSVYLFQNSNSVYDLSGEFSILPLFRPVTGSLTEARGQKANIHIIREMLQLCEIIDTGGYVHCEETPGLKVMFFGELFDVRSFEIRMKYHPSFIHI